MPPKGLSTSRRNIKVLQERKSDAREKITLVPHPSSLCNDVSLFEMQCQDDIETLLLDTRPERRGRAKTAAYITIAALPVMRHLETLQ